MTPKEFDVFHDSSKKNRVHSATVVTKARKSGILQKDFIANLEGRIILSNHLTQKSRH